MGPTERTRAEYQKYLASEHWRLLRAAAFRKLGRKCARCPATCRLQVHHARYRWPWTSATTDDLLILCRDCHIAEHGLEPEKPAGPNKKERKRIRARLRAQQRQLRKSHRAPKQKRFPKLKTKAWWPGMYEGKSPGIVQQEIGTDVPPAHKGSRTPPCMDQGLGKRR